MDIARRIAKYEDRGFTRERAEINVLMEHAAFTIFKDFPEALSFLVAHRWCCITTA